MPMNRPNFLSGARKEPAAKVSSEHIARANATLAGIWQFSIRNNPALGLQSRHFAFAKAVALLAAVLRCCARNSRDPSCGGRRRSGDLRGEVCRMIETGGRRAMACRRLPDPADLAGKQLPPPCRQPGGRAGNRPVHAGNGRRARPRRSFRPRAGDPQGGGVPRRTAGSDSAISALRPPPITAARAGRQLARGLGRAAVRDADLCRDRHPPRSRGLARRRRRGQARRRIRPAGDVPGDGRGDQRARAAALRRIDPHRALGRAIVRLVQQAGGAGGMGPGAPAFRGASWQWRADGDRPACARARLRAVLARAGSGPDPRGGAGALLGDRAGGRGLRSVENMIQVAADRAAYKKAQPNSLYKAPRVSQIRTSFPARPNEAQFFGAPPAQRIGPPCPPNRHSVPPCSRALCWPRRRRGPSCSGSPSRTRSPSSSES